MSRLLSAGFVRLKKDKVFWFMVAIMALFGVYAVISTYMDTQRYDDYVLYSDSMMFVFMQFIGMETAAFSSLFIGTEYSDGAIRNKLVIGHGRSSVYFSNLILSTVAMLAISLAYMIPSVAMGTVLFGDFQQSPKDMIIVLLGVCLLIITFSAIVTMLSMLIQNKALVAVISLLSLFGLMFAAIYLASRLNEPEFYENLLTMAKEANPSYLRGTKREVFQFLFDFLPTGHAMVLSQGTIGSAMEMWGYPSLIAIVTTVIGVIGFRKKDLK